MAIVGSWTSDSAYNVIVGAPKGFNLKGKLSQATKIKMAVAFMKHNGLEEFLNEIANPSQTEIDILVGLDFLSTEPKALRKLLSIRNDFKHVDYHVVLSRKTGGVFHPKILVVHTLETKFALVGSANCTNGGHHSNCECMLYVDSSDLLAEIEGWMNLLKSEGGGFLAMPLTYCLVKRYEAKRGKAAISKQKFESMADLVRKILVSHAEAEIRKWDKLVAAAKEFNEEKWPKWKADMRKAVVRIRELLDYPEFEDITKTDWDNFFKVYELGHLIAIRRDGLFEEIETVAGQFRNLIDESIPLVGRINSALAEDRVAGLGPNLVTKILTSHNSNKYPTWNNVVAKSLSDFGLELPRSSNFGPKYVAFQKIMAKLVSKSNLENMLALDAFLYDYWERNIRPKKKK